MNQLSGSFRDPNVSLKGHFRLAVEMFEIE